MTKNADDFFEAYKDSISMIPVNINGIQIELPVTYSSSAAEKYRESYKDTKDYRQSFCTMIMDIVTSNWGFIYEEELKFELENLLNASDEDLRKVYDCIVNSFEYLSKFNGELDPEITDFYERFYNINKREYETYI
jgi:hypothetical protein